jgi:hypothetical protein
MINSDIIIYIRNERAKGISDAVIRASLASGGWNEADLAEAFAQASKAPLDKNVNKVVTPELAKYRKDRKWLIFTILMIVPFLYAIVLVINDLSNPYGGGIRNPGVLLLYFGPFILGGYFGAVIVSKYMKPQNTRAKEFWYILGHIILGAILTLTLGGALCFATCIFVLSSGAF